MRPLFDAPDHPVPAKAIRLDPSTTPKQLTVRTAFAGRAKTFPAALLMVGHQLGEALVPVIMGIAIDRAVATGDVRELLLWIGLLGLDFLFLSSSYRFGSRLGLLGMETVQHQLRMTVSQRLLDPAGVRRGAVLPGEALSIATSDVGRLSSAVAIGIFPVGEFAAVVFSAVLLLAISWPVGLLVLIGAPLLTLLMDRAGGPLRRRSEQEQELAGSAIATATDLVAGLRVLKGIGATGAAAGRYRDVSRRSLQASLHAASSHGRYLGAMTLSTGVFTAGVAIAAGYLALTGQMTVGELIAVVGIAQFVMYPLQDFAVNFGTVFAVATASAARVLGIVRAPSNPVGGTGTTSEASSAMAMANATVVANVSVAANVSGTPNVSGTATKATAAWLPGAGVVAGPQLTLTGISAGSLQGLSLTIAPGECVGVVADPHQAADLVDVLARVTMLVAGRIVIDATDYCQLTHDAAAAVILVAPHQTDLFEGSVVDNVLLGRSGPVSLHTALEAACCQDIIAGLPDGVDSAIGEDGRTLSGGQRQRIALARAFAAAAPLLVLHDPTTAVDSVTEAGIAARLTSVRGVGSTVLLSTSPALLSATDRVVVLTDGRVSYTGRHHELLAGVQGKGLADDYRERLG